MADGWYDLATFPELRSWIWGQLTWESDSPLMPTGRLQGQMQGQERDRALRHRIWRHSHWLEPRIISWPFWILIPRLHLWGTWRLLCHRQTATSSISKNTLFILKCETCLDAFLIDRWVWTSWRCKVDCSMGCQNIVRVGRLRQIPSLQHF